MARTPLKVAGKKVMGARIEAEIKKKQKEKSAPVIVKKQKNVVSSAVEPEKKIDKKKRRFKPGTVALREIRQQQKSIEPALARASFSRLVRELMQDVGEPDYRLGKNAVDALRYASEQFLCETFKRAQYLAIQVPGNENSITTTLRVPTLQAARHWMFETMHGLNDIGLVNTTRGASQYVINHAAENAGKTRKQSKPKKVVKKVVAEKKVDNEDEEVDGALAVSEKTAVEAEAADKETASDSQ